jgi:hypothetical protein
MARIRRDQELYRQMRDSGVRKRVARQLAKLPALGSNGKGVPKAMRDALDRLDSVTSELRRHAAPAKTKPAARKPARTGTQQASAKNVEAAPPKPAEEQQD